MTRLLAIALFGLLFALAAPLGCAAGESSATTAPDLQEESEADEEEVDITVAEVPALVRDAALAALPGVVLLEAQQEFAADGTMNYELSGTLDGVWYEIEVAPDGTVIEVDEEEDEGEG